MVKRTVTGLGSQAEDEVSQASAKDEGTAEHAGGAQKQSLVSRGKNVLSGEAGGVATAVVIGVGAAIIEVELLPGLIIGVGAILLGKMFPQIGGYVRPALKNVIRAGMSTANKAREVFAEAGEQVTDIVAEVKHERDQKNSTPAKTTPGSRELNAGSKRAAH